MVYTEAELKAKTVKDLKELARELGAPAGGKKDELVGAILAAQGIPDAAGGAEELDDGLADDVIDSTGSAGAPDGSAAAPPAAAAAEGKHASIVFALDKQQAVEHKKANIVGIKTLSDSERAQLRAAKFGLAAKGGTSKPTAGGKAAAAGAAGISTAGGVGVGLEEEIKKLQRAQKFGKLSEQDEKKLTGLQKKLEAQKEKQRLALDKAELLGDTDKLKARQEKYGKLLTSVKDPKDPELMKKRAEKFKPHGLAAVTSKDDEARKKARLERFAKGK